MRFKLKFKLFYNPENFIDHNSIEVSVEEKWQGRTKFDGKYSIGRYDPKIKFIEAYQTQAGVKVVFENGYDDVPSTQSRLIGSAETNQKLNNGKLQKRHQQLIGKMGYVRSADGKKLSSALFSQQRDLSFGLSDFRYFELRTRSEPFLVRFKNVKFPFAEKITKEESGL